MIVVVPMAGGGTRLRDAYDVPKPFVQVAGRPMVAWAFESVRGLPFEHVVFVTLAAHRRFGMEALAETLAPGHATVIEMDAVTDGQLRTVLAAREIIDTNDDLLIASSDTVVESRIADDIQRRPHDCRGLISVMPAEGDHWSFAQVDDHGRVIRVAEKERISPLASTGLYYFASGREFVTRADAMIAAGRRSRGEFYVMPLYQDYLDAGLRIDVSRAISMWDMGNPESLRRFEARNCAGG